jgi:hypothetical protein
VPSTYEKIATATVGTAGTSFLVMNSIPSTYTDLMLIINGSSASAMQVRMRLNNDSSSSYSSTVMGTNGSTASGARSSSITAMPIDYFATFTTASGSGVSIVQLMNYSNTTTFKNAVFRANTAGSGVSVGSGLYASTNAITRIDIISADGSTNISVGTTFNLYGIKAA